MKSCAFGIGMTSGIIFGIASYILIEPCLSPRIKRSVRRGRRAVTRAVENMI